MIYAIYIDENGYDSERQTAREYGLVKGQKYLVETAEVGGWKTYVLLKACPHSFNSVMFEYVDENGNDVDIVKEYMHTFYKSYQ